MLKKKDKKIDWLIALLIAFVSIVYITLIFNDSVWGDEAYTMLMLKKDYVGIVKSTAADVHPPLYYFIAKLFTIIFGYSVTGVKIASVIPVILVMIFVQKKSKKIFENNSRLISILFILLIGFCPRAFVMNVELRMYTWAMLFVTCSGVYVYELYKNTDSKKSLALFILFSLCAAYTHYYAALTECFIYLFLIIGLLLKNNKNWKKCLILITATILGYLPWIPVFIKQFTSVKNGWWLEEVTVDTVLGYIKYLFESEFTNAFLILIVGILIGLLYGLKMQRKNTDLWFAFLSVISFIMTVLIGVLASEIIRPMFLNRYMYPAVGLLFLGISIAISKSDYKDLMASFLIGLIILNLPFSYFTAYKNEYRTGTEKFKEFVKNNISVNDTITSDISHLSWTVLEYYFPGNKIENKIDKNTQGYVISQETPDKLKEIITNGKIDLVYKGNIDSIYFFNIYYVK